MTSEQDHIPTAYTESLDDDDDSPNDDDLDLREDDDDDGVTIAATAPTAAVTPITVANTVSVSPIPIRSDVNNNNNLDQRRLFQRLWTDEDEIELLQGFLEYSNRVVYNNHHDTTAFYDSIKDKLQLDFNKNQLVEKLRRLKKKYRNVVSKISSGKDYVFKTAHDQITFEISSKIWRNNGAVLAAPMVVDDDEANNVNFRFDLNESNGIGNGVGYLSSAEKKVVRSQKRPRSGGVKVEEKVSQLQVEREMVMGVGGGGLNMNQSLIRNVVEETVKSCLLPLFKELVEVLGNGARGGGLRGVGSGGMNLSLDPFSLGFGGLMNFPFGDVADEKWRKQHILELEICSKRLELVQDQIKSQLEELRSVRR